MKKLVFGIDIGGTNTAFGLVDENGEIFGESAISTKSYMAYDSYPRYIEDLATFTAFIYMLKQVFKVLPDVLLLYK